MASVCHGRPAVTQVDLDALQQIALFCGANSVPTSSSGQTSICSASRELCCSCCMCMKSHSCTEQAASGPDAWRHHDTTKKAFPTMHTPYLAHVGAVLQQHAHQVLQLHRAGRQGAGHFRRLSTGSLVGRHVVGEVCMATAAAGACHVHRPCRLGGWDVPAAYKTVRGKASGASAMPACCRGQPPSWLQGWEVPAVHKTVEEHATQ